MKANNYKVTVVTNKGTYNYKNVIAYTEIQARKKAEYDVTWATREEVLESEVTFVKVLESDLLEDCENEDW